MSQQRYELQPLQIQQQQQQVNGPPNDRLKIVWIVLFIHGVGTLMPWNMFINAEAYFRDYKLNMNSTALPPITNVTSNSTQPLIEDSQLQDLRKNFISYIGLASQLPNVIFNGLNLVVNMGSGNLKLRVNLTLIVEAFVFVMTIMLAVLDSSRWPIAFFYITMASVVVLNMSNGIYQNCIFGTGAKFPMSYTNAILIGSNFSGTFTSVVGLLTIWLAPQPQEAAIYYFVSALFVILICIISYNLLPLNNFFWYVDRENQPVAGDNTDWVPENITKTVMLDSMNVADGERNGNSGPTCMEELSSKWKVFLQCWPQCLNVFLTFFFTLALFPAVLANIHQVQPNSFGISKTYFTPFACFFVFNLFAMIGNLISGFTTWPGSHRVWILVVLRIVLLPFFLFCNFNPDSRKWPVYIQSDLLFIVGNIVLAVSTGYLSSLCMMFASKNLPSKDAQKAGMIAAFFLVFGIFMGINSQFILTWLVEIG